MTKKHLETQRIIFIVLFSLSIFFAFLGVILVGVGPLLAGLILAILLTGTILAHFFLYMQFNKRMKSNYRNVGFSKAVEIFNLVAVIVVAIALLFIIITFAIALIIVKNYYNNYNVNSAAIGALHAFYVLSILFLVATMVSEILLLVFFILMSNNLYNKEFKNKSYTSSSTNSSSTSNGTVKVTTTTTRTTYRKRK